MQKVLDLPQKVCYNIYIKIRKGMILMQFEVRKAYNDTFDRAFATMEEVMAFVQRKAAKMNYGMYRSWEKDGVLYFDCGPTVYAVHEKK